MTIEIYEKPAFKGASLRVTKNHDDLKGTCVGTRTSSIMMSNGDRALFFTKRGYRGSVMCRRHSNIIESVGNRRKGGKAGFGNSIRSVRLSPFVVRINFHIVRNAHGEYPGRLSGRPEMDVFLAEAFDQAKAVWAEGFVKLVRQRTNIHDSEKMHDMRKEFVQLLLNRSFSTQRDAADVFVVNSISRAVGMATLRPKLGTTMLVAVQRSPVHTGNVLAHELGHMLGLSHSSSTDNIMHRSDQDGVLLSEKQLETVHSTLSIRTGKLKTLRGR